VAYRLAGLFTRLHAAEGLARQAVRIACDLDHPVYDCVYLALADRENASMVTADRRLSERLQNTPWHTRIRLLDAFDAER
jgi:predicted nucleic acid-binding protein